MGENSKRSGEIGEALATALLDIIGWKNLMHNVSIDCNTRSHVNADGNPRQTHGEDQIFLYHNPFHDHRTDIVHVSNKNVMGKHVKGNTLKTQFKSHIKELLETMECAKYNPKVKDISSTFGAKKYKQNSGLLIWLHNDIDDIDKDIITELQNVRLDIEYNEPIYVVDNFRATFLLNVVDNIKSRSTNGDYNFFYPRIGTAISVDENRTGRILPLELIAADIIPVVIIKNHIVEELVLYTNEEFNSESYRRMISYGLSFCNGLVKTVAIGMAGFNPAVHQHDMNEARMAFNAREETITAFSYKRSILDLLQEKSR